jgi:hypothetical protein
MEELIVANQLKHRVLRLTEEQKGGLRQSRKRRGKMIVSLPYLRACLGRSVQPWGFAVSASRRLKAVSSAPSLSTLWAA